jgi:hypothetical protein
MSGVATHVQGLFPRLVSEIGSKIARRLQQTVEEYTLTTMSFQDTARGSAEVTLKYLCHAFCTTRANGMRRGLAISRTIEEGAV